MRTSIPSFAGPRAARLARGLALVALLACGSEHAPDRASPLDAGPDSSNLPPQPQPQSGTGGVSGTQPPRPGGTGGAFPFPAGSGGGTICNGITCCNEFGCFPDPGGGQMCFDCGSGCFDCGFGCECSNVFQPPPWTPPFANVGAPGWGESTELLCAGMPEIWSADLWASAAGVHVIVSGIGPAALFADEDAGVATGTGGVGARPSVGTGGFGVAPSPGGFAGGVIFPPGIMPPFDPGGFDFIPRTRILRNEGSGWRRHAELQGATSDIGLWGASDRDLLVGSGFRDEAGACMLAHVTSSDVECVPADPIDDIFVVSPTEAFALMQGTRVLRWDGTQWSNAPGVQLLPYPAQLLWASATELLAFGTAGTVLRKTGVGWELLDLGTFETFTAVWGPASNDLWLGTNSGRVLHYDGTTLEERYTLAGASCGRPIAVRGLYQAGDTLYMHSTTKLARARNGGELESLGDWTCQFGGAEPILLSVSGTGANDAFLLVLDQNIGSDCGALFTLHFDGDEFHRM